MKRAEIDLIAKALAEVEELNELVPDPLGIGASTLRIVVDSVGAAVTATNSRYSKAEFEMKSLPRQHERFKQVLLAKLGASSNNA